MNETKKSPNDKPESTQNGKPTGEPRPPPEETPIPLEEALRRAMNTPPIPTKDIPKPNR